MDKIPILLGVILLAMIVGIIAGFVIGPVYLERTFLTDLLGITSAPVPDGSESSIFTYDYNNTSEITDDSNNEKPEEESRTQVIVPNYPIVGKWEVSELVEVDAQNMDEIGAFIEFFNDKTGTQHHSEEPKQRDFTWETESGRLTITPVDPSYRIRIYDYEIDDDLLIIFFNRNRTSYFEAIKVR